MRHFFPILALLACGAIAGASDYSDAILNNTNPSIYWGFEETTPSGPVLDLAWTDSILSDGILGYQATMAGAAGPQPSDSYYPYSGMAADNRAMTLDGQSDVAVYSHMTSDAGISTDAYSMSIWFNSAADFSEKALTYFLSRGDDVADSHHPRDFKPVDNLAVGGNFQDGAYANRLIYWNGQGGEDTVLGQGTTTLMPGVWYNAVLVRDNDAIDVYLDGQLELTATSAWLGAGYDDGSGTLRHGNAFVAGGRVDYYDDGGAGQLNLNGHVDETVVWNRALTAAEVADIYGYAGRQPMNFATYTDAVTTFGPEAYWRLNETTGTDVAADATGNGHDFTYHAAMSRTGAAPDLGPQGPDYPILETGNAAPTLSGDVAVDLTDGYLGTVTDVLGGTSGYSRSYTVEMWVKPGDIGDIGAYMFHRQDFQNEEAGANAGDYFGLWPVEGEDGKYTLLYMNGAGGLTEDIALSGQRQLESDKWYHVGITRDWDSMSIYVNGDLDGQCNAMPNGGTRWGDGTWTFGGRSDMPELDQHFNGQMDEIAIYRGAMSDDWFLERAEFFGLESLTIPVEPEELPGDLDGDGFVGSSDLDIVRGAWGLSVTGGAAEGDPSGDGVVGSADLDIVRGNWGSSLDPAAVPEPGVLALLACGLVCLARRRR